jgi:hypothetical protein
MTETVRDKLAREAYKNNLPYPRAADMSVYFVYNKGTVIANGLPAAEVTDEMKRGWKDAGFLVDVQKVADDKLKEARRAHGAENQRLMDEFRNDVERENDMVGHPKVEKIWTLVSNERSSLNEKVDFFEDLAELVK